MVRGKRVVRRPYSSESPPNCSQPYVVVTRPKKKHAWATCFEASSLSLGCFFYKFIHKICVILHSAQQWLHWRPHLPFLGPRSCVGRTFWRLPADGRRRRPFIAKARQIHRRVSWNPFFKTGFELNWMIFQNAYLLAEQATGQSTVALLVPTGQQWRLHLQSPSDFGPEYRTFEVITD